MPTELSAAALLSRFQELREQGRDVAPEQLCADCPHLLPELMSLLRVVERMGHFHPGTRTPDGAGTSPHAQDPSASGAPFASLPGYEVLGELGHGGMGVVYQARQVRADRLVALKVIRAADHAGPAEIARFRTEAEAAARLQHPGIAQVHEVGEHDGLPFFSMEYCAGGTLKERLAGAPLPPADAAQLVEQLAGAVQHAHDHGVIHRDLKPANILLPFSRDAPAEREASRSAGTSRLNEVKIADFGLARKLDEPGMTASGAVMGTPSYMAPEQARGDTHAIGPAADVYGLGAILYECLTGRPPFRAATSVDTILQVLHDEPVPPRQLQPKMPGDLDTICLKCLQKGPARRYASARELADDLRRFLDGRPVAARPVGRVERVWRWCRRNRAAAAMWIVVALALLLLVPGGVVFYLVSREAQLTRYLALFHRLQSDIQGRQVGWSFAGLSALGEAARLRPAGSDPVELRSLAATCLGSVDLGPPTLLLRDYRAGDIACSADGRTLALPLHEDAEPGQQGTVVLFDLGERRIVHQLHYPAHAALKEGKARPDRGTTAAFSPDGRWLAAGTRSGWLHVWDRDRLDQPCLSAKAGDAALEMILFSPDSQNLFTYTWDGQVACWAPEALAKPLLTTRTQDVGYRLALSRCGSLLACVTWEHFDLLDPASLLPCRPRVPRGAGCAAFSPDSRVLAVGGFNRIGLQDLETGSAERPFLDPAIGTAHENDVVTLEFNRDGSLLLSVSEEDRNCKVWDVASRRLVATLYPGSFVPLRAHFTPTGDGLLVAVNRQVSLYPIGGLAEQRTLAQHAEPVHDCAFSGDGEQLACLSLTPVPRAVPDGCVTLWDAVAGARRGRRPTSMNTVLADLPQLAFHPRRELLALCQWRDQQVQVWNAQGEAPRALTASPANLLVAAPDGSRLWGITGEDTLQGWAWEDGKVLSSWHNDARPASIWGLAVSEHWVLAGCQDGLTRLLRVGEGALKVKCSWGHMGQSVTAVALSPDESLAVSATQEGAVQVVRVASGEAVAEWHDHGAAVQSVAFSPDGHLLAIGSRDQTVRLYVRRGETFRPLLQLPRMTGPVQALRFHPGGRRLAMVVRGETAVRLWHLDLLQQRLTELGLAEPHWPTYSREQPAAAAPPASAEPGPRGPETAAAMLEQAQWLREHGHTSAALLWAVRALERAAGDDALERHLRLYLGAWQRPPVLLQAIDAHDGPLYSVALDPAGKLLATAGKDGMARVWDVATRKEIAALANMKVLLGASFTHDGKELLTWARDGGVCLWDVRGARLLGDGLPHPKVVDAVALHPDGKRLASGCGDGCVRLWQREAFLMKAPVPSATIDLGQGVVSLNWSPDGKRLICGCKDKLECLDVETLRPVSEALPHPGAVGAALYSPDGRTFVTTTTTSVARLWSAQTLVPVGQPMTHREHVTSAGFSKDGRILVTGSMDHRALLWDAATCCPLSLPLSHPRGLHSVAISPDGSLLATGCDDGKLRLWGPLPRLLQGEPAQVVAWAELETGMELTADGRLRAIPEPELQQRRRALVLPEPPAANHARVAEQVPIAIAPLAVPRQVRTPSPPRVNPAFRLTTGGGGGDQVLALGPTGDIYVAGTFTATLDFGSGGAKTTLTSKGSMDGFVARSTADGDLRWVKQFSGRGTLDPRGIATDAAGNVFVAGWFTDEADFGPATVRSAGKTDGFVTKLNEAGDFLWASRAGGNADDRVFGVAVDRDGDVYVTGEFREEASFGAQHHISGGTTDGFVAKLKGTDGTFSWTQPLGGGRSYDAGRAIRVDGAGQLWVAGGIFGNGTFGTESCQSAGEFDMFLVRLDRKDGTVRQVRGFGGRGPDEARALAIDAFGNIYLAGYFNSHVLLGTGVLNSAGPRDAVVVKLNSEGRVLWARRLGGAGFDYAYHLAVDRAGDVYLTGYFEGRVADFGPYQLRSNHPGSDFVAKLDARGTIVWAKTLDTVDGCCAVVDAESRVFVTNGKGSDGRSYLTRLDQQTIAGRVQREGEGIAGVVVELFDATDDALLGRRTTEAGGVYRFAGPAGSATGYYLQLRLPPGLALALAPGFDEATGRSNMFTLPADGADQQHDLALRGRRTDFRPPVEGLHTSRDVDGNTLLVGLFSGEIEFDLGLGNSRRKSNGGRDAFAAKYTAAGALLWARTWGGPEDEELTESRSGPFGEVTITGRFSGSVDFDPGPREYRLFALDGPQHFKMTIDGSGNFVSAHRRTP